ncbi:putative metacaspase protein [Emiliania huxleyi CCMP1516]|uniref:Peptidase C14 caspase domain-containing protein n=2 Tax=Emiliania huxleyi TaxID=2903 RepID=A0A0D3K9L8_EMIH1|nr:putative metacaspase protein [Emiliania huxleyi CCMP1516]EOD32453.1 putative metacaspase protein [Emiliania huxleyi CCMP1516]|eukprot:XP_005784882.1 putative metacaspase protein [Emiliania huxleyi CCMP1516]
MLGETDASHVEAAKAKVAASATKASAQKASAEAAVALKAKRAQSDAFALNSPVERRGLCICCSYPNNPDVALPGAVSDQRAMEKMLIENGYEVTFISDEDSSSTRKSGEPVIVIDPSHTRSGQRGTVVEAALGEETTVRFADGEVQAIPSKSLALDHSTREGMLSNIKALCEWLDAKPNRQGWISYSGHGAQTADTSGEEADGLDECMIPTDYQEAGLLTDDDLKEICAFRNDSSLMVFMDCCTILDLPFELQSTAIGPEYEYDDGNGLIFCVSAALDSQEAFETNEGGICTRAFLGAYTPGAKPAEMLEQMRRYAKLKKMPQLITMHSNREFSDETPAFTDPDPVTTSRALTDAVSSGLEYAKGVAPAGPIKEWIEKAISKLSPADGSRGLDFYALQDDINDFLPFEVDFNLQDGVDFFEDITGLDLDGDGFQLFPGYGMAGGYGLEVGCADHTIPAKNDLKVKVRRGSAPPCGPQLVGYLSCLDAKGGNNASCTEMRLALDRCMALAGPKPKKQHKPPINYFLQQASWFLSKTD